MKWQIFRGRNKQNRPRDGSNSEDEEQFKEHVNF
jgi:hypothetical protein